MEPFAARLDIELIQAPSPVAPDRAAPGVNENPYGPGQPTTYIHFLLNQRTIPLGLSYAECGLRSDGWCELGAFLNATADAYVLADYDFACNGKYPVVEYGGIENGAPLMHGGRKLGRPAQ